MTVDAEDDDDGLSWAPTTIRQQQAANVNDPPVSNDDKEARAAEPLVTLPTGESLDDAIRVGHVDMVIQYLSAAKVMLATTGILNRMDPLTHRTALHACVAHGRVDLTKLLLQTVVMVPGSQEPRRLCSANVVDAEGFTPLHRAILSSSYAMTLLLLSERALPDASDAMGRSALHLVAFWNRTEGAVMRKDKELRMKSHALDVLRALLLAGADVNKVDSTGSTPIMYMALSGQSEMVEIVLEAGASVSKQDFHKGTVLHNAVSSGSIAIVQRLIRVGADVNAVDDTELSALHEAANEGYVTS